MLQTQSLQEAGLLRRRDVLRCCFLTVVLNAVFCSSVLGRLLCVGGGFVVVGGGFMEVEGGAERERLVAALADKPMELTDAAAEVRFTPDLHGDEQTECKN